MLDSLLKPVDDDVMCINYQSARQRTLREEFFTEPPEDDWDEQIWQDYDAPIIIAGDLARQAVMANYGFIPQVTLPAGARFSTMNARAETIGQLKSYRDA
jgi:putative SOS response-associated peptidase YedK